MTLVRIGHVIFNFDQVTYIKDSGSGAVMVELVGNKCMDVHAQADTLRAWLATNTVTPAAPTVVDPTPVVGGTA
jgi:hypothetical protein